MVASSVISNLLIPLNNLSKLFYNLQTPQNRQVLAESPIYIYVCKLSLGWGWKRASLTLRRQKMKLILHVIYKVKPYVWI